MKEKHKHHIIPRHAGGTDNPENIVELTIEEHAEAHRKLYEEHGRWQDELAWKGLSGQIGKDELIQEMYKWRRGHDRPHTGDLRRFGMANKGVPLKEEHKKKIGQGLKGKVNTQNQKDLVADANSMKWIIHELSTDKKFTTYNLNEFARKHNLGTAWQGNAIKHGYSKGYKVKRLSLTKSTPTSGYRTKGKGK